jgi:hypothetical protein
MNDMEKTTIWILSIVVIILGLLLLKISKNSEESDLRIKYIEKIIEHHNSIEL